MENKFEANILLCKKIKSNKEFDGVFNILELEECDKKVVSFDVAVFLKIEINEEKKEQFFVNILKDRNGKQDIYPLGELTKRFNKCTTGVDFFSVSAEDIPFEEEGMYSIEVRLCKEYSDDISDDPKAIFERYKGTELIHSFSFYVKMKK